MNLGSTKSTAAQVTFVGNGRMKSEMKSDEVKIYDFVISSDVLIWSAGLWLGLDNWDAGIFMELAAK